MKWDSNSLLSVVSRYKKAILIGGISFLAITGLLVFGAGFVIYKTAAFATEKAITWSAPETLVNTELPKPGFVEGVVLGAASEWLERSITTSEARPIQDGLSCFDALGGPSPVEILTYVKSRTSDPRILGQLGSLEESLNKSVAPPSGAAACASWIFSSYGDKSGLREETLV